MIVKRLLNCDDCSAYVEQLRELPWIVKMERESKERRSMFGFQKKNKELEAILLKLHANASNNYKDAAQSNYRDFLQKFEELKAAGKIRGKQAAYYEEQIRKLEPEMKNYTHYDQKADFHGLGELKSGKNV